MFDNLARNTSYTLAGAAFAAITASPIAAGAADILTIPVNGVSWGNPGSSQLVASTGVPADLIGKNCAVIGTSGNGSSIHPGNDLVIVSGDESIVISDFEDTGNAIHRVSSVRTLGTSVEVYLRFGQDGVSSGGVTVSIADCVEPAPATTTTMPAPATTVAPTTAAPTTAAPTTPAPTTAVAVPTTAAPTTAAPTTAAPTTAAPITATSTPAPAGPTYAPSTTVRRATTSVPATAVPTSESPTTLTPPSVESTSDTPIDPQGVGEPLTPSDDASNLQDDVDPAGPTVTTGNLAFTGGSAFLLVSLGILLLAGGVAFWVFGIARSDDGEAAAH